MTVTTFSFPTTIDFGPGAIQRLPDRIGQLGGSNVLLVSDRGLEPTPAFAAVREQLDRRGVAYTVFLDVQPNPLEADVEAATEAFRAGGCDLVVGVGGGSPLDVAKAVRLLATHDGPLAQYDDLVGGDKKVRDVLPPMIAIPTTAGTGSEVGRSSVITIPSAGRKVIIFSPYMLPSVAIDDPALTVGLPPDLTAATGMDALVHNLEAVAAPGFHPLCDGIGFEGIRLAARSLARAVEQGDDLDARTDMMASSMMGAIAFQKGLGAVHAMAHPLSVLAGVPHGLANAICLEPVLRYNREAARDAYARAAAYFGYVGTDVDAAVDFLLDAVQELRKRIGIPASLKDAGVGAEKLEALADEAAADGSHQTNPRPCTREDLLKLFHEAYG